MADAEVQVVVRASDVGFDRVAERMQQLESALKRFGEMSRNSLGANMFSGFTREIAKA